MLTKGSRAGGVGIKPGLRTVMLHGHPPEASSEGVPLFLQREVLFPTKQWNHTCELQPVRPGSWACNLVLGHSPEVSSQSWEGQPGRGVFDDPADVGNLSFASSAFSKTSLNIWKFMVHVLLKPGLENFECYFTSV